MAQPSESQSVLSRIRSMGGAVGPAISGVSRYFGLTGPDGGDDDKSTSLPQSCAHLSPENAFDSSADTGATGHGGPSVSRNGQSGHRSMCNLLDVLMTSNLSLTFQLNPVSDGTIPPLLLPVSSGPGETISREGTDELNTPPISGIKEALHTAVQTRRP